MKTKNIVTLLLTLSGVGIIGFILWKLFQPATPAKPGATANAETSSPFSALYNGWGKLFGGQAQTDNTGALITASGNVLTGAVSSLKSLFGTPVASPVASPVSLSPGIPLAPDPVVTSYDIPDF